LALVAGGGFEAANGRRLGEFAPDSALEEAVLSELVSVRRFRAKLASTVLALMFGLGIELSFLMIIIP
jgi:hypothetical protein